MNNIKTTQIETWQVEKETYRAQNCVAYNIFQPFVLPDKKYSAK